MVLADYYVGNPLKKDAILHHIKDDLDDTLQVFKMTFNTLENRQKIKQVIDIVLRKYQEYFIGGIESEAYIPTDEYGIEDKNSIDITFKRK